MERKGQLQQCQENVEEVQVIIQDSMNKIQEREYSLEELDERGEALRKATLLFQKTTNKLRQNMEDKAMTKITNVRCKNRKVIAFIAALVIIVLVIIIIIITVIIVKGRNKENKDSR